MPGGEEVPGSHTWLPPIVRTWRVEQPARAPSHTCTRRAGEANTKHLCEQVILQAEGVEAGEGGEEGRGQLGQEVAWGDREEVWRSLGR